MSELLKVEGILESLEPLITSNTKREFWLVRLAEAEDVTYSTFDKKIMEKLEGNEGKSFEISYKKSADGKYNNVSEVFVEGERQAEASVIEETYRELWGICVKLKKYIDSMPKE